MPFVVQAAGAAPLLPRTDAKPPIVFNSHCFTGHVYAWLKYWGPYVCFLIKVYISDSRSNFSKTGAGGNIWRWLCTAVREKPGKLQVLERNFYKGRENGWLLPFVYKNSVTKLYHNFINFESVWMRGKAGSESLEVWTRLFYYISLAVITMKTIFKGCLIPSFHSGLPGRQ